MATISYGVIYCAFNHVSGKYYIGQTTQRPDRRWIQHQSDARRDRRNGHLHNAIKKYGANAFDVQILAEATTCDELNRLERLWILLTRSFDKTVGYNMTFGGDAETPIEVKAETRLKLSLAGRDKPKSEEWRKKIAESNRLRWVGTPRKVWNVGVARTEDERRRISETRLARIATGEITHPNHGKHLSEDTKRKISEAHKRNHAVTGKVA